MPEYKPFAGAAGLRIEVEDLGTGGSGSYASLLGDGVRQIASQLARTLSGMEGGGPSEVVVEFHLSGSTGGGYTITRDGGLHNFRVRMTWSSAPATEGVPAPPPATP